MESKVKINGEYPKFYMRVENKRYAALHTNRKFCHAFDNQTDSFTNCIFLWREVGDCESNLFCSENKVIYVEVPEE